MNQLELTHLIVLLNSVEWYPERWQTFVAEARAAVPDCSPEYMFAVAALEIAALRQRLQEKVEELRQDMVLPVILEAM